MKNWIRDIREKTKYMNRRSTVEYIVNYYWYHIVLFVLALVLVLLSFYHILSGDHDAGFHCVIVNEKVDYDRDTKLEKDFASFANQNPKEIYVDSDYLFSYEGMQLKAANESSYEKFFFNWSSGEIDAVIMPESFYQYCKSLEAEFEDLSGFLLAKDLQKIQNNPKEGVDKIAIEQTSFVQYLSSDTGQDYVLVFPNTGRQKELSKKFLEMALG